MTPEELALAIDALESYSSALFRDVRLYNLPVHEETRKMLSEKAMLCKKLADKLRR